MRVLHVINSLSGSGGAEQGLVREITRLGDDLEQLVVRLYSDDTLAAQVEAGGIPHETLGLVSSRSGWNWPLGVARLRRLLAAFQPDVVHSSLFAGNLIAQLATRGLGIPVLSTFTLSGDVSLIRAYQPGAYRRRAALLRWIGAWAARADHVWYRALTQDTLETTCTALSVSRDRGVVIPRGVPIPDPQQNGASRAELGFPEDLPVVLSVGRQTAQKGHGYLVRAFSHVLRHRPAHLVILGREGDGTEPLHMAIRDEKVEAQVTVIDYTESVYDYYRRADVFALSSLMEGLGTAVLEAMAAGLPVVAFDIPPVREATDNGRVAKLVPVGDDEKLGAAILEVLEDGPEIRQRTEAALDWVRGNFSLDHVVAALRERLVELATRGSLTTTRR